jgi:hypothetical protein
VAGAAMTAALFRVETKDEVFFIVVDEDREMDMPRQLAAALGLKMSDQLPRPLSVERMRGRVAGRVKP